MPSKRPSWQSYLVHPVLRLGIKRRLRRARSPLEARAILGRPMPPPPGARFTPGELGGVAGEWVEAAPGPALLYLHGGGYFTCSPQSHRSITSAFALRGFKVFAPAYRLAPEHVFPAAVEDALEVYRAFLARGEPLVLAGDSAGGGLALAVLLAAKASGLPMPACVVLFSPWTDLACTGESVALNARRDALLYAPRLKEGAALYLGGADPRNPLASPLYGDLSGLPPMLIQVGRQEILLDDSTRVAARARAAGVEVALTLWRNVPHVWQVSQIFLPEARLALHEAAAFAHAQLAKPGSSA